MDTNIRAPQTLFQNDVQYTIPPFQRSYVWTQDEQWEPLWDDVRNVAENYLEELERSGSRVEAENNTARHFLGAVVLKQMPTATGDLEQREVVDGQQRMTTLQLLLDAIQQVCEQLDLRRSSRRLTKLVANDEDLVPDESSHYSFKLWPTRVDREAFRHAMDNGLAVSNFEDSLIVQAHEFFQLQVLKWLEEQPEVQSERADGLVTAVTAMLQLIVIDLDGKDDPNIIFETLNARGTPLEQSDLVRNFVMSEPGVTIEGDDGIWGNLDDSWWREEIRQARVQRPRVDMLLNYWLEMRTGNDVSPTRVFDDFRKLAGDVSVKPIMQELRSDLEQYRRFQEGERSQEEDRFHYRLDVMQLGVITRVLLPLLSADQLTRVRAFNALESFLVRRMICRRTTRGYSGLCLDLVNRLRETSLGKADTVVADFLRRQVAYSNEWPGDAELSAALETAPLYRLLTRGRLRLVLEAVEGELRSTGKSEQTDVPRNLTIEHLMPVSWQGHWPLPDSSDDAEAKDERNRLVHTIGNLTLLNQKLNSSVSNRPWSEKRAEFQKFTVLNLNGELAGADEWDDTAIKERSRRMAELVIAHWPGPDSDEWLTG